MHGAFARKHSGLDMTDTIGREDESIAQRVARRLYQGRWPLAASAIAVIVAVAAPSWQALFLGVALVAGATALAPRRPASERKVGKTIAASVTELDGVTPQDIASAVPSPLIIFDSQGGLVYANPAAEDAFGPLLRGISMQLKFRAPEMQELIERTLSARAGPANVVDYAERVPVERVFRVTATSIGEGKGLFALVFKDQSEARRIDRMRADFIANASHELRTPLASIAGFVETLRGPAKNDAAARDHFLQIMQNQTSRMARLIDDLLSLSRLEMKPYFRPGTKVDLRETLQSVIDSLSPRAVEAGVDVETNLSGGPFEIAGDRDEIFQVFENLLENAIKYGQSGRKVIVSIRQEDDAGRSEIEVGFRDFGPGIAEEHIPRVTERFYRVDVEASRAQKGTGLGLAIVKHILTRHNARLSIKSEVGHGATFTVHFPSR